MRALSTRMTVTWESCYPADLELNGLGWGLRLCFANKLPGDDGQWMDHPPYSNMSLEFSKATRVSPNSISK